MITLRNLRKVYGDVTALDGVSLHIDKATIHGIVGESGAGKSTLVRCLTGLERPTEGAIELAGQDIAALGEKDLRLARRTIGMVFQNVHLFDSRTALSNIAYPLRVSGTDKATALAKAQELLTLVGIGDRGAAYPGQLSGGQRQRVGIARALITEPDVLLLDEPTSALDAGSTNAILDLVRDIRDRLGVTVVIITHEMEVVRAVCDGVTLLEHGRIVETGRVRDVVADARTRLSHSLAPLPPLPVDSDASLDVFFTSMPGNPTGARVFEQIARAGGDIAAGTLETIDGVQVGRVAISTPTHATEVVARALRENGLHVEGRDNVVR
ncbi:D-methionine transport system ATP-binding protein [Ruaniaceae bacterium KH17]|nr:D-methionine transport system ATP-binding protein [Ruaniaceae bacterium KH17]